MPEQGRETTAAQKPSGVAPKKLTYSTICMNGQTVIKLSGSLVSNTTGALLKVFSDVLADGCESLHLDLSDVHEISRAGVRGIVVAAKVMQARGGEFQITGTHSGVLMTLDNLVLKHLVSNNIQKDPPLSVTESRAHCPDDAVVKSKPIYRPKPSVRSTQ